MNSPRISASSYSNTAPLLWSFLYGRHHGEVEVILDNAPSRSAELLVADRVDAALVPVIACQLIDNVRVIPDVCVGAKTNVRSVCLVTNGTELADVRGVALDTSSMTSAILTKIIFREFLNREPEWRDAEPDIDVMLEDSDAALIIGDPALRLSEPPASVSGKNFRIFDLAEVWNRHTSLGFVFAMWMTRQETCNIDFAAARDEGLEHIDEIAANYASETGLSRERMADYLRNNVSYSIDDSMRRGMELYFELAAKHGFIEQDKPLAFTPD